MSPTINIDNFSGGLNNRDMAHLLKLNEATRLENVNIRFQSLKTLSGEIREKIDYNKYPSHPSYPGSAGGTPNNSPILGEWRYYSGTGEEGNNGWIRVHGEVCEYLVDGTGAWVTIGAEDWPDGYVPNAIQYGNRIYVTHGALAAPHLGKYLYYDGAAWQSGDIPIPAAPDNTIRPTAAYEYQDRIFFLDSQAPFTLRFTGVGTAYGISAADGGGFVNKGRQKGDAMVGLRVHRGKLYVFRNASVWIYYVDYGGIDYFEQVQGAAGCISHRSICAYGDALYYASNSGMNCIYGADNDCVSLKINDDLAVDPDYIDYTIAAVDAKEGTLWVTVWSSVGETATPIGTTETGGGSGHAYVFNTTTYRADIRREYILNPRWVKLVGYRITCYAQPPGENTYKGGDWGNFHFAAQQPDVNDWNPNPTTDPSYILAVDGGPRHYSYRYGSTWDRDRIPARGYEMTRGADGGIGYGLFYSSPRFRIPTYPVRVLFQEMRLDYFVWKSPPIHPGFDDAYGRVIVDDKWLRPEGASDDDEYFPIDANTPQDPIYGGYASEEWGLAFAGDSKGCSIKIDIHVFGISNRAVFSHGVEFRFLGINFTQLEDKYNPEEGN